LEHLTRAAEEAQSRATQRIEEHLAQAATEVVSQLKKQFDSNASQMERCSSEAREALDQAQNLRSRLDGYRDFDERLDHLSKESKRVLASQSAGVSRCLFCAPKTAPDQSWKLEPASRRSSSKSPAVTETTAFDFHVMTPSAPHLMAVGSACRSSSCETSRDGDSRRETALSIVKSEAGDTVLSTAPAPKRAVPAARPASASSRMPAGNALSACRAWSFPESWTPVAHHASQSCGTFVTTTSEAASTVQS